MKKILAILITASMLLMLMIGVPFSSAGAVENDPPDASEQLEQETDAPTAGPSNAIAPDDGSALTDDEPETADQPLPAALTEAPSDAIPGSADVKKVLTEDDDSDRAEDPDVDNKSVPKNKDSEKTLPDGKKVQPEAREYVEGEAVVLLEDENALEKLKKEVYVKETITLEGSDGDLNFAVVSDKGSSTEDLIEELSDEEGVESVVPNAISVPADITNDPYSKYQWALNNTGQNSGSEGVDINPETAWSNAAKTKKQCVVAVMDSGIDTTHKDLKSVLWKNTNTKLGKKGACGYDFTDTYSNHVPKDDQGHGSHVAGIIAASANNNSGISGVNKSGVKIMAVKVIDKKGETTFARELKGFQYIINARKLGVNIKAVNCSYGGLGTLSQRNQYDKIFNTLGSLGIITCVSAGNQDYNIDYKKDGYYYLPSSSQSKYCLTVAAVDEDGSIAGYSNYGNKVVDIAAPGNDILSTVNVNTFAPSIYNKTALTDLCAYYQSYDVNSIGNIGYDLRSASGANFSDNDSYTVSSAEFSGTSGKSLRMRMTNAYDQFFAFELPFTLNSSTGNYYVSAVAKCRDADVDVFMYDIPAGYDWDDGPYTSIVPDETWTDMCLSIKPGSTKDYYRSTNRRLGFIVHVKDKSTATVYFDHIAISKQGVSSSKFGKLAYKSGTSMACPYVAGAVALVANAYPTLSAGDILAAVKNSATKSAKLTDYVASGRLLNLKNIAKYAKHYYALATPKIKSLTNSTAGVSITIGKVSGAVRYSVYYKNGKSWVKLGDTKTTTFTHKTATSGKKYCYTVRCVSKDGKKYQSDFDRTGKTITYVAAPKPPTLRNTDSGVRITFKRVAGAAKYRIFRKTGSGGWVKLCDTAKTDLIDRTVKRGVTYRYTVRCMNKNGKYVSAYNNGSVIQRVR